MKTTPAANARFISHEFHTPEDFADRTLFDAFADAFTPPEDLPLHQPDYGPDYGMSALIRDRKRIRGYFDKALAHEGFDQTEKKTKSKRLYKAFVISRKGDNGDSDKLIIVSRETKTKDSDKVFVVSATAK